MSQLLDQWRYRWPDFAPSEVACRGCTAQNSCHRDRYAIVPEAMDCLQALRNLIYQPVAINSAYRCPFHNVKVGGAPRSHHRVGDAFDISIRGMIDNQKMVLVERAKIAGFTGFGFYGTFLHVDLGKPRKWHSRAGREEWNF